VGADDVLAGLAGGPAAAAGAGVLVDVPAVVEGIQVAGGAVVGDQLLRLTVGKPLAFELVDDDLRARGLGVRESGDEADAVRDRATLCLVPEDAGEEVVPALAVGPLGVQDALRGVEGRRAVGVLALVLLDLLDRPEVRRGELLGLQEDQPVPLGAGVVAVVLQHVDHVLIARVAGGDGADQR
jgi:hypothetical protein